MLCICINYIRIVLCGGGALCIQDILYNKSGYVGESSVVHGTNYKIADPKILPG